MGDKTTPLEIQTECEKLMLAINANDLSRITDRLIHLGHSRRRKGSNCQAWKRNHCSPIDGVA